MPLPTLIKTWQISANLSNTPSGIADTDLKNTFILALEGLLGAALPSGASGVPISSNPWTCIGSSNHLTAAMDGVNRLTTAGAIVCNSAGNAHSWVVIQNATGAQVCFDFANAGQMIVSIIWSPNGGFTGGSTTARPTATNEQQVFSDWLAANGGASGMQFRVHVLVSSDGQCTRVFFCANSNALAFWSFEQASNPVTGWTYPQIALVLGSGNNPSNTGLLLSTVFLRAALTYYALGPVSTMPLLVTGEAEGTAGGPIVQQLNTNEISTEYPIQGCGLWHGVTAGQRGRHGFIADLYFTSSGPLTADTFPASGTHLWTVMGNMVVPTAGLTFFFG